LVVPVDKAQKAGAPEKLVHLLVCLRLGEKRDQDERVADRISLVGLLIPVELLANPDHDVRCERRVASVRFAAESAEFRLGGLPGGMGGNQELVQRREFRQHSTAIKNFSGEQTS
jgi:hypothetical protein